MLNASMGQTLSLSELRLAAIALLAFAALLRFDEIDRHYNSRVSYGSTYSKTDQFRQGLHLTLIQ